MKSKLIVFRADGNSSTGLGHLYRLFSLVEILKDNYNYLFITKENSQLDVIPNNYCVELMPNEITLEEEVNWMSNKFDADNTIIIADGYQFVSCYQKLLKNKGFTLIYIDDLTEEYMYSDIVVNHSPYIKKEDYISESYTEFALGTSYVMLRPTFNEAAKKKRHIKKIESAFICFGGTDSNDLSLKALSALLNIKEFKNIHVVLGGAYEHKDIFKLERDNESVYLHKNLDEYKLCELMKSCQIAIAPSSTILYEICSVKMPVISGYYVENQKNIYKGLLEKEAIIEGGDFSTYEIADFQNKVKNTLKNEKIDLYIENQQKLFKGNSRISFLGLINRLNISYRKATEEDVLDVYNWSNDTLVRENSFNSSLIQLESHRKWFSKKIKDVNTLFLIALVNQKPAGMIRYDINKKYSIIGLLVSKDYRGQKLASKFLMQSAKIYFTTNEKPILAYIKKDNDASVKAFSNAKYEYFREEMIKGLSSFVFKLEKKNVKE